MIFNIQRYSTHDGTGIRTIIFFKGCSLRCPWCENPESQSFRQELAWDGRKCIGCLDCLRAAEDGEMEVDRGRPVFHRERIRDPGKFREVCPSGALAVIGEEKTLPEILREIEKDLPFYRKSGGGVTVSGGEPYDQPVFLRQVAQALAQIGLRPCVESALSVPWSAIEPTLGFVDRFLADVKHTDAKVLKAETGGDFPRILENLRSLERSGAAVTVRVPVLPGFNDSRSAISGIIDLAASLSNVRSIHFLPYHTLGTGKYELLGRAYTYSLEPAGDVNAYLDLARARGLQATIGG